MNSFENAKCEIHRNRIKNRIYSLKSRNICVRDQIIAYWIATTESGLGNERRPRQSEIKRNKVKVINTAYIFFLFINLSLFSVRVSFVMTSFISCLRFKSVYHRWNDCFNFIRLLYWCVSDRSHSRSLFLSHANTQLAAQFGAYSECTKHIGISVTVWLWTERERKSV